MHDLLTWKKKLNFMEHDLPEFSKKKKKKIHF